MHDKFTVYKSNNYIAVQNTSKMGLFMRQLYYMLYKNFLFKIRNKRQTVMEILIVLYFVMLLVIVKKTTPHDTEKAVTESEQILFKVNDKAMKIGFVKKTGGKFVDDLVRSVQSETNLTFYEFDSEDKMDDFYKHDKDKKNFSTGILFEYNTSSHELSYTIKTPFNLMADASVKDTDEGKCRKPWNIHSPTVCPAGSYVNTGFSSLQAIIDVHFIQIVTNQSISSPINIGMKMFPKRKYDPPQDYLKNVVMIYMNIAFAPYILFLLTNIVTEKENKIKESMKIMGLNMTTFWLSWFITYAVVILIGCIMTTIISSAAKIYGDSQYVIIFLILFLFGLSIITLSFLFTIFFKKAKTAGMAGSLGTILLSLLSLLHIYLDTSNAVKWLTCLLSPVALSLSLTAGLDSKNPLTFSNLASKGDFPASNAIIMIFIDIFLYLFLAMYLDAVFPGEYGKAKHPLFPFLPSYWKNVFGKKDHTIKRQTSLIRSGSIKESSIQGDIEEIPEELLGDKVISIKNLRKVFKQGNKKPDVRALDGVTLDIFEGQITALLGHNGAGKSTLISTLTGMLVPTEGNAEMYGLSICQSEEMDDIRQIIGLCPQQNIIFEQLNAREHLKIYAGIKGLPPNEIDQIVDSLLKDIDLHGHATTLSKDLSGGQKRKLCVGIALIGNPKIVFLDEPTSGMDPSSRRQIWSLLQSRRNGRVIFLTTHFMDEADILADYKAIMTKGKIRCAGTSLFLKSRFGVGYHLGMVLEKNADILAIQNTVKEVIPTAEISRHHGKELAFRLPLAEVNKFPELFNHFEESKEADNLFSVTKLGITSYGVSITTLEEVFLKLEEPSEEEEEANTIENSQAHPIAMNEHTHLTVNNGLKVSGSVGDLYSSNLELNPTTLDSTSKRTDVSLWVQFMALLEIRWKLSIRSPMKIVFQAIIPPILLVVGLVLFRNVTKGSIDDVSSVKLPPSMYLKQGSNPPSDASDLLWKLKAHNNTISEILNKSFSEIDVQNKNMSTWDLIKLAPHAVAIDVLNVGSTGQIDYIVNFNDTYVNSLPVGINTISNAMYHLMANKKGITVDEKISISVYNKRFKSREARWVYDGAGQAAVMLIGLCFVTMLGGFTVYVVMTRQLGIRHQLRVSGTSRLMYWLQILAGDMLFYVIPIVILFIVIPAMNIHSFNMANAMGAIFLLLLLYIPANLFFSYTLSFMFTKWETTQNAMPTIINMIAIIPYYIITTIDMTSGAIDGKPLHAVIAMVVSALDPPSTLLTGLYYIARVYRVESILQQKTDIDNIPASKYFDWYSNNALPAVYLFTFIHLIVFSWAAYAIDCYKSGGILIFPLSLFPKSTCRVLKCKKKKSTRRSTKHSNAEVNEDVREEKEKVINSILESQMNETSVIAQGLKKKFGDKQVVNDINILVNRGEIFGLLGPNGAGKTTTLNMITADLLPDNGQIFVDGNNIETDLKKAFQSLGYCPQFDALWEEITIREHLKCYGLIKGVLPKDINTLVTKYAQVLKITEHMDKRAKELSGGTKRKLSFLMSMIGDANVIIMDEPSCGMDPSARRFLWTAISSNTTGERGVILTTHSMEEADALCGRLGIVVKGEVKCVGTTQELKSTYGGGYQLEIKFKTLKHEEHIDRKQRITDFVSSQFPDAQEVEYFGSRITYKIPKDEVQSLASVFQSLEAGKNDIGIEEYSFSQSTLEQVFLQFAKEQDDDHTGVSATPTESMEV